MFMKAFAQEARLGVGRDQLFRKMTQTMSEHGSLWADLDLHEQHRFDELARWLLMFYMVTSYTIANITGQ